MKNKVIFSLDIGSSKIVSLAGVIRDSLQICGVAHDVLTNTRNELLSVNRGVICDLNLVSNSVSKVLNQVKTYADCGYGSTILNISGEKTRSLFVRKKVSLGENKVTNQVIHHLALDMEKENIPDSYDLLDYEIQEYLLDGQHYTSNPLNLVANTIESNINMFLASSVQVANLKAVLKPTNFSLARIVPSGILSGIAVLNNEEKDLGCCLLDIGAGTTDVVVYQNGYIRYLCSIPLGGELITRDIANVFKISRSLAEDIKLGHGAVSYNAASNSMRLNGGIEIIDHRGLKVNISRKMLISVMSARLGEILEWVKTTLNKNKIYDIIDSGFVLTGGCALIAGVDEFAKSFYQMPVRVGLPQYEGEYKDIICNPRYSTSIGGLYFIQQYMLGDLNNITNTTSNGFWNAIKKIFFA